MGNTATTIASNLTALGFDNPSAAALYNKIATALGITIDQTIQEMTNSENNILSIINSQRYGKPGYYTSTALAFQYGDDLVTDPITLDLIYATIDASKQIINQAAFEEIVQGTSSQLFLKVATLDPVSGLLTNLNAPQYSAFSAYFTNFELPGLPVSIISNPANILNFNATATFYSTYNQATLATNVQNALISFRNSFLFNGEFFNGDLSDYVKQQVPGMRDFFITTTSIDGLAFNGSISLAAGYFNYIANIFNQITYIPVSA